MPDHLHLFVEGLTEDADCKAFISSAKQYSGYHFRRQIKEPLWQRYGYERTVRSEIERAFNPFRLKAEATQ